MELTATTRIKLSKIIDLLQWHKQMVVDADDLPPRQWSDGKMHQKVAGKWKEVTSKKEKTDKKKSTGSTRRYSIPNQIVTKTQDVTKRDTKGRIIDSKWYVDKGTEIRECEHIASGLGIKKVSKLIKLYPGTNPADWYKQKGIALIKPKDKSKKPRDAEIHWYYSKQTGQVDIKRKGWK